MESRKRSQDQNQGAGSRKQSQQEEDRLAHFEVPCEQPQTHTSYKVIKQSLIGGAANFKVKYSAAVYPQTRQRYSIDFLIRINELKNSMKKQNIDQKKIDQAILEMPMTSEDFEKDYGLYVICKNNPSTAGLVIIKDFLTDKIIEQDVPFNDSIRTSAIAINCASFKRQLNQKGLSNSDRAESSASDKQNKVQMNRSEDDFQMYHEEVQLIMGTTDGQIFQFDPVIRGKIPIQNYHYDQDKNRLAVEIVKWLEVKPNLNTKYQNRFLVVFSDGSISFYHKEKDVPMNYDYDKDLIKLSSGQSIPKGQIIKRMKHYIGQFNFDEFYNKTSSKKSKKEKNNDQSSHSISQGYKQEYENLKMKEKINQKRQFNYVACLYDSKTIEINPYFSMKYDCRSINDIVSTYLNPETMYLIAACNDCFIRVFSFVEKDYNLIACLKGVFGAPLCLDLSQDKTLLAAGFEDDSFVIYNIKQDFAPMCRGIGHHSFVTQIKFDQYLMNFLKSPAAHTSSSLSRKASESTTNTKISNKQNNFDPNLLQNLMDSNPTDPDYIPSELSPRLDQNRKSSVYHQIKTIQRKTSQIQDQGTFRLVTTGDDCTLCFWSFERKDSLPLMNFHPSDINREVKPKASLAKIKPLYIFPIPGGQLQSLTLSQDHIFTVNCDGLLTIIKCTYKYNRMAQNVNPFEESKTLQFANSNNQDRQALGQEEEEDEEYVIKPDLIPLNDEEADISIMTIEQTQPVKS